MSSKGELKSLLDEILPRTEFYPCERSFFGPQIQSS